MTCLPRPSVALWQVTTPVPLPLTETVAAAQSVTGGLAVVEPCGVKVSEKETDPESATLPEGLGVTVAVKVTCWLTEEGSAGLVITTLELAGFTVCVVVLLLPPKFGSVVE